MSTKGDNTSLHHEASAKIVDDMAKKLGGTDRHVFSAFDENIGDELYLNFLRTGNLDQRVEKWCLDKLKPPAERPRAFNLLSGTGEHQERLFTPVMGLSRADMHDLDAD